MMIHSAQTVPGPGYAWNAAAARLKRINTVPTAQLNWENGSVQTAVRSWTRKILSVKTVVQNVINPGRWKNNRVFFMAIQVLRYTEGV